MEIVFPQTKNDLSVSPLATRRIPCAEAMNSLGYTTMSNDDAGAMPMEMPRNFGALKSLRAHWREYFMEAVLLGTFMISACSFGALYEFPSSPIHKAIASGFLRRVLTGLSMGLTAIAIIYSPWGKQSGAHINPSVTLTFFRFGKIKAWDAVFYIAAQFTGAAGGVFLVANFLCRPRSDPPWPYVVTTPGPPGPG